VNEQAPYSIIDRATCLLTPNGTDPWPSRYTTAAISKRLSPSTRLSRKLCPLNDEKQAAKAQESAGHFQGGTLMMKFVGLTASILIACGSAHAQSYPTRPITMVAPFAAGGATDVVARIVAEGMSEDLGQYDRLSTRHESRS
jgi:hypothetical protein